VNGKPHIYKNPASIYPASNYNHRLGWDWEHCDWETETHGFTDAYSCAPAMVSSAVRGGSLALASASPHFYTLARPPARHGYQNHRSGATAVS